MAAAMAGRVMRSKLALIKSLLGVAGTFEPPGLTPQEMGLVLGMETAEVESFLSRLPHKTEDKAGPRAMRLVWSTT